MGPSRSHSIKGVAATLAGLLLLAGIFAASVTWNHALVIIPLQEGGRLVVLADGDCQSRMQRAAMVASHPGTIIRAHDFENFPQGTVPHTTAPMDYLIAGLAIATPSFDLAGAWISPLLGLLTVMFLWFWSRRIELRPRWPMLLLFCVSPALTHAFALGRPDHQSLLVALTTVALAANMAFLRTQSASWAWTSGAAWGLALWVSWFEPLILLATQEIACGLVLRRAAWPAARRRALLLAAALALIFWALEGFRDPWPSSEVRELFPRWASLLGELQPASPRAIFAWTGWLLIPAPLLLAWDFVRRRDPLAMTCLILLVVVTALTGWQARWSPWLASALCLSLPWILRSLQRPWIIWTVFIISLWPVAGEWEARLVPPESEQARRAGIIAEAALLEETAAFLRSQPPGGVLAPWWISPALARLGNHPMVGGTSHQSLPGSADTARFFLAGDWETAAAILRERRVNYVVGDAPERIIPTSAVLLGIEAPEHPVAARLARGKDLPPFLQPVFANAYFRVYKVDHERL